MADSTETKKSDKNAQPSSSEPNAEAKVAGTMEAEVSSLEELIEQHIKPREASLQLGQKIRIGLLVIIVGYFSFLYWLVAGFDANSAVMMMRGQLEAELPAMKAETITQMKVAAPQVVDSYAKSLVANVPSMRQQLEDQVLAYTNNNVVEMEAGLNDIFVGMIKESKTKLDQMGSASTEQKLDRLTKEMTLQIGQESQLIVEGLGKEFKVEIGKINKELKRLQTSSNLTAKEKSQKELLRVVAKLMQMKMKDINKAVVKETETLSKGQGT